MSSLSEPTKKRLVVLYRLLQQKIEEKRTSTNESEGNLCITSKCISELTGWTDATIRRDISLLGIKCGAAKGYNASLLLATIRTFLSPESCKDDRKCCIVGLESFGAALLNYTGFTNSDFTVVAGFDENVNRVELLNANFPLYPASKLEQVIQREKISYGILAVPDGKANNYAQRLCKAGITGIVNCTGAVLTVSEGVAIENASVIGALQNLVAMRKENSSIHKN
ncbi:MAG: CoA-binding protein [Spirochaetaceae bacterium]|nr:CoA-binding protein [Spirochaetaceae bacterium]